ncbi:5-hydroxytryptamine receptor 2A isoform X2 [Adelges cooleyi]|uniref:5-hydroxytryptamine receptor 2A isoform X2 n=1 Tax=Adelges cooleyi TaxID=133065 RepID=UPI00217F6B22|nr:5-hydroxytryptamine receptor 2A isoform X2 [Adelges cooleyi]
MEKIVYFNESHLPEDHFEELILTTMTVHVVLVALIGTSANIFVFLGLSLSQKVASNLLLLNLCVADSLVCLVSGPLTLLSWHWPEITSYTFVNAIRYVPVAASTLSLMTQSIDRYASIQHPRHNRLHRNKHVAYLVSGVVTAWTVAVAVSVPRFVRPAYRLLADMRLTRYYETAYVVIVFVVPWAAVAFSQRAVSRTLYITSLKAAAARGQLPLPMPLMTAESKQVILVASIQKSTTGQSKAANEGVKTAVQTATTVATNQADTKKPAPACPTPTARSRKRLAKVLLALAGVFVACWMPYATALIYSNYRWPVRLATVAALLFGHTHSVVNPLAYWWLNRHTLRPCPCWNPEDDDDDDGNDVFVGCGFGCGGGRGGGHSDRGDDARQPYTPTRLNRLLFRPANNQRSRQPSSTNEAALGPFNPRFATPKKRPEQLPVKNPVMLYYS